MLRFLLTINRGEGPLPDESLQPWLVRDDEQRVVFEVGAIRIQVDRVDGAVRVEMPFAGADQLYYQCDAERLYISNDPRQLFKKGMMIDKRGLYSLLQFGAIIPPLSIWQAIKRFTPGRDFTISANDLSVSEQDAPHNWPQANAEDHTLSVNAQVNILTKLVDQILLEACPDRDPVILFSGGIDSGVLAARAAAMGWKNTVLLNYSMGDDDPESDHAEAMARHLGLHFCKVPGGKDDWFQLLNCVAQTYRHPFGDPSCLPTYELAMAAVERFAASRRILDGTGADGAFGLFGKARDWRRLYRLPQFVRRTAASVYKAGGFWQRDSRSEYFLRLLGRAAQMSLAPAAVAQNLFHGFIYHASPQVYGEIQGLVEQWMDMTLPSDDDAVRLSGLDLALVCSDLYAQKDKSIFDANGRHVVYPFLDRRIVGLALGRASRWPGSDQPKHVLKLLLASQVPHEMVYRPKSGFSAPVRNYFSKPRFLEAFDQLLCTTTPLAELLDLSQIRQLRPMMASGIPMPLNTYSFIWTAVFSNLWLEQLEQLEG